MKKIQVNTVFKKMLADVHTPVGIYLRLRDRFRDTILLESADSHAGENSYSFIGINAIGGIEVRSTSALEYKFPGQKPESVKLEKHNSAANYIWNFMQRFEMCPAVPKPVNVAQGMFGYTTFDAIRFFETIGLKEKDEDVIPFMRYRLYQYVIAIDHFKDELYLCENRIDGIESEMTIVERLIKSHDVPVFPFEIRGGELTNMDDGKYKSIVNNGVNSCKRGDVFQVVLSRRFGRKFVGDDFNVYRTLRSINPSPYLFYFDYGDYKLFGSSPESQLKVGDGYAVVHPIAGTFRRTGDDEQDRALAIKLENDAKENAEHVMLVDLARNDLSRICSDVKVAEFKKVNYYSHVIHLVSEVTGKVERKSNPFDLLSATFPAGTLSGAPKYKAMQIIDELEPTSRGYYGGAIGFVGFNGDLNHAIMIRTFMSKDNTLWYQAGAGITVNSVAENELQEVNNKLAALKKAINEATGIR